MDIIHMECGKKTAFLYKDVNPSSIRIDGTVLSFKSTHDYSCCNLNLGHVIPIGRGTVVITDAKEIEEFKKSYYWKDVGGGIEEGRNKAFVDTANRQ